MRLKLPLTTLMLAGLLSVTPWQSSASSKSALLSQCSIATSSVENEHSHTMILQVQNLDELIESLRPEVDSLLIESGEAVDHSQGTEQIHSHSVMMNKGQLQELKNAGKLRVESEAAVDHSHYFEFEKFQECSKVMGTD